MPVRFSTLILRGVSGIILSACPIAAQNISAEIAPGGPPPAPVQPPPRSANDGTIFARPDARTITLKIPAPRGQIVDRNGEPFAQSRVAYQVGLQFRQFDQADRDFVIDWARTRLDALTAVYPAVHVQSDDELWEHYRHRRWLPLLVTSVIAEKEAHELEKKLSSGLILHPIYSRYYPHDESAAHILGYTGIVGKLPTGPINFNEPLWEESEGRAGFETLFERELTGIAGQKRLLFDESGKKLLEEQTKRPMPGGTLVTTLNLKWQLLAEKVLREGSRRGAFVVIDVITGEVLVMASRPSFDLNSFVPRLPEKVYEELNQDPATPLIGRAFQSMYPPASAFKPIVALTALNNGIVTERSTIYCPASIAIGNHVFRNWTTVPEGSIDVRRAIARSCNTWFYQVGISTGAQSFLNTARQLGMGETTGLPLLGEKQGIVPNDAYMQRKHHRRILSGDTANMSIGQGDLLASPLQVAQAMAGIANGSILPKLQLVRQIQDSRGRVIKNMQPERRQWLGVDPNAVAIVRDGMNDVVNGGGGTGQSGSLSFTTLAGKTGTAQWGDPKKRQGLAWFAGFLPHDSPRYAFAVLYEGRPGEKVSGGRLAAPMVRKFFEPLKDDIKDAIAPPVRALVVNEVDPDADVVEIDPALIDDIPRAIPVDLLSEEDGVISDDPVRLEDSSTAPLDVPRALPVDEDDLIEEGQVIEGDLRQVDPVELDLAPEAVEVEP